VPPGRDRPAAVGVSAAARLLILGVLVELGESCGDTVSSSSSADADGEGGGGVLAASDAGSLPPGVPPFEGTPRAVPPGRDRPAAVGVSAAARLLVLGVLVEGGESCGDTVAGVLPRRDGAATSELLAPVCDRLRFISHDPHSSPPLVYSTVMCFGMSSLAGRSLNVLLDLWFFLAPQKRHCSKRRMYFSGGTGSGLSLVVAMPACSDASAVDDTTGADVLDAFDAFGFSRDPLPVPES